MGLVNKKIYINCTGPYILYMDVCYMSLSDVEAEGTLQVKVEGKDPLVNFTLHALNEVCRGLQSIVYFRVKDEAYLDLYSSNTFKIKNMTMGLSYLLGRRCDF